MSRRQVLATLLLLVLAGSLLQAEPPRVHVEHKSAVRCLAWSPNNQWLGTGAEDGTLRILESATGKEVHRIATGHPIVAVVFSPDGKTVALSQVGESLSTWDIATGKHLRSCPFKGYKADHLAFTADGGTVMAVAPNEYQQWRMAAGSSGSRSSNTVGGCSAISPEGQLLASHDGKSDLVRLREYQPLSRMTSLQVGPARCMAVGPEGKVLAVGSEKGVQLWDVPAQKPLPSLPGPQRPTALLSFTPNGHTLAAATDDGGSLQVWDLKHQRLRRQFTHNRGKATALALSHDGKWVATVGMDGKAVTIWNATARELSHKGPSLKLSPQDMAGFWVDLAHADPGKADAAWLKFGAAGDHAVPFLQERIRPVAAPAVDKRHVERLLSDLDAESFRAREQASKELTALGELAIAPLQRLLENRPSLEAERRAMQVLEHLAEPVLTPDRLRVLEAIGLLEQVRTTSSIALLREIERDALIPQIRLEAKQALLRVVQVQAERK